MPSVLPIGTVYDVPHMKLRLRVTGHGKNAYGHPTEIVETVGPDVPVTKPPKPPPPPRVVVPPAFRVRSPPERRPTKCKKSTYKFPTNYVIVIGSVILAAWYSPWAMAIVGAVIFFGRAKLRKLIDK